MDHAEQSGPSREWMIESCRRMLLIRHFEETLIGLQNQGHFAGHYHVYIGQEATGVPALGCLAPDDHIFTTHRNHGHLLARGADPGRMYAEILGRRDGYNKGKGGTFHIAASNLGFHHTSGIVAGIIPLATGAAYAAKARKSGQIAVCLFGDGALEEGAAPESFNIAALWKLPVLYLCENNGKYGAGRAVGAAKSFSMAAYPLTNLPEVYKIPAQQVDGTDPRVVYGVVSEAVRKIRQGEGPQFIETHTVRWPGSESNWPVVPVVTNVDLAWDASAAPEKFRDWYRSSDPVLAFVRKIVEQGAATRRELADIDGNVVALIDQAAKFALASPFPDPREALTDVFA
jgi:TPP-dependent pyruvate/acetoin dehydrogenase alpha subunit